MSLRSKLALTASAAMAAAVALTTSGSATAAGDVHASQSNSTSSTYVVPTGGATTLRLDPRTAQVLTDNGVSVTPASEARVRDGGIAFPVSGGLVNATTLGGKITHRGGLTFSAGGKDLTIRDFTINTSRKTLSAYVDEAGARIPVLDLDLSHAKVSATKHWLRVANVKAGLTSTAAGALDSYFGTSLFQGGLRIGTATVRARSMVLHG
jgi:hypothetical protein